MHSKTRPCSHTSQRKYIYRLPTSIPDIVTGLPQLFWHKSTLLRTCLSPHISFPTMRRSQRCGNLGTIYKGLACHIANNLSRLHGLPELTPSMPPLPRHMITTYEDDLEKRKEKKRKSNARTIYRRECKPVVQMLDTSSRVVALGV